MYSKRLRDCLVEDSSTIKEVMVALGRSAVEIALVVNEEGKLVGTCTDGDLRRGLLAGSTLECPISPHIQRKCVSVGPEAGRAEVLDLMRARQIQQVPILSADGNVLGLHLMRELIGAVERPNWAVLMAGGRGTRLRPLTEAVPKPLIPVAGRPILERLVLHLVGYGIRQIFISINYLGDMVQEFLGDGSKYGCAIEYLCEDLPLGTGGSLTLLPELPEHALIVMNGDLVTSLNIADMLDFHTKGEYVASLGIREYCHSVPFGVVEIQNGNLQLISEKPTYSWMVNTGCYVLNPELIVRMPKRKECTIVSLLEDALARGERIGAYSITQDWIDVGRISDLARALGSRSPSDVLEYSV